MKGEPSRARLLNSGGELVAEGMCWLDEPAGQATLEVERTPVQIQRQRGLLSLELDSGRSLLVSDKPMVVLISPQGQRPSAENRRRLYRLRLVDPMAAMTEAHDAQEADAVDAVEEGRPTASMQRRLSAEGRGETSAAR